jgi:hypothetical protein
MVKSVFPLACAALCLFVAGTAEATNKCTATSKKPLQLFSYDTAGIVWQNKRIDSPLDPNTQRLMVHVLDNSSPDEPYDYAGAIGPCTGIEKQALPNVRNLSYDFLNTSTHPVHNGAGAPRISVEIDTDGDLKTTEVVAYLAGFYCEDPLAENPAWSRADFTGRVTAGCQFYTSEGGPYASDGAKSAWAVFAEAHPTWKVVQAYLVMDEDGTAFIDRLAFHNRMFQAPGNAGVKICGSEAAC